MWGIKLHTYHTQAVGPRWISIKEIHVASHHEFSSLITDDITVHWILNL